MSSVIRGSDNFDSLGSKGLGDGQTWQDLTGSRSSGVTYTNTTGRAIFVSARCERGSNDLVANLSVDGIQVSWTWISAATPTPRAALSAVIPNGSTYNLTVTNGSLTAFLELR